MKYPPGSFSKNFAWHGTGLRRLYNAIRGGFHDNLKAVGRNQWRTDSGINDRSLDLIPVNFFLHNASSSMSVDELVFQAVKSNHTIRFDRLAFFSFHLNRVGNPPKNPARPSMWANEFVREALWIDGSWRSSALSEASMDAFIVDRLDAQPGVRLKCRTNYRHLFELCDYLPARLPMINSGAEQWIASALYLTWDRMILGGGSSTKGNLLAVIRDDEIYKLLGVTETFAIEQAQSLADHYLKAGGINRFDEALAPPQEVEIAEQATTDWIDQDESDAVVERRLVKTSAQVRDRRLSAALKLRYKNTCVMCGERLQVAADEFYSEAAHIKPLGKPHDGPDKAANMIVLCPNHHLQFDRGILRIRKNGKSYETHSKVKDDPLNKKLLVLEHALDDECVSWHWDWFGSRRT